MSIPQSRSVQTHGEAILSTLSDGRPRRPARRVGRNPAHSLNRTVSQAPGIRLDQPLTDIHVLISELNCLLERYELISSRQFVDEAARSMNHFAIVSIREALEEITATAVGINLSLHDGPVPIRSTVEPAWTTTPFDQPNRSGIAG